LDASNNDGQSFEWEIVSKPKTSKAVIQSHMTSISIVGPLDVVGVYCIRLWINHNEYNQKNKTISLNVPGKISLAPFPDDPLFDSGGRVRNFSFELPGILAGYPANWDVVDDAGLLNSIRAGLTRGRCIPNKFSTVSGKYVMVLGDDEEFTDNEMAVGDEFSIVQEIDFTNMNILEVTLKFRE